MANHNSKQVMGKMLIVSYYFPPIKAISSFRNYCLAKYFQKYFTKVEVISTSNHLFLPKEKLPLPNLNIYRAFTVDYRTFFHSDKASGVVDNGSKWHHFFRNLKNSFPFNLLLDLGGPFYIFFGILIGLYRIRKSKPTHLLSSFHPYADHLIAYVLKRFYPSIHWIADFNNLHIEPDTNPLTWPNFQRKVNRFLLKRADTISTVSEGLVPHLQRFNDTVVVLENSIDQLQPPLKKPTSTVFTISYTGSLYVHQTIHSLLTTVKELIETKKIDKKKIQLQYAGASSTLWNQYLQSYGLSDINKDLEVLSINETHQVLRKSQINLLLSWTTLHLKGIIPAKFYDYLAIGQPILMLINGEKDMLWETKFDQLNAGLICYETNEANSALQQFIFEKYQSWQQGKIVSQDLNEEVLNTYLWAYRMPQFLQQIGYLPTESVPTYENSSTL